jgi:DNA invertase Pin-like site-specific DNA recombinase
MTRAALYIRVSSDRQAKEGDSIPAQREALRQYAQSHHMQIYGEYIDDGVSGTREDRDELSRLLSDVEAGRIDIILITKLDRLYRSLKHYLNMMDRLDRHNVGWLAIWENYDTTTPQGRLIVSQMMSIAQFEAENTGQRVRAVLDYKISHGEVASGSVPFGYVIRDKRLVPGPHADDAREIFKHYAMYGNLHKTARLSAGFGGPVSTNGIKNMLRNEKYVGMARDNPQFCEAIIDKSLFDDVQRKLSMNVKISQKHTYIFSGLVKCAECGASMGVNRRKRKRRNCITIEIGYRCPVYYQRGNRRCSNAKVLNENVLERHLLAVLRPELEKHISSYEIHEKSHRDAERAKKAIEGKLSRLKDLYVDGLIDMAEYRADRERLESELSAVADTPQKDLTELKHLLTLPIQEIYETFSREEKRFFWRSIVKEIRYGVDKRIDIIFV